MRHKRTVAAPTAGYPSTPAGAPSAQQRRWGGLADLIQAWHDFWFTAVSPFGLHVLRVLIGVLLVAWLIPFAGEIDAFFGLEGWLDEEGYRQASRLDPEPPMPLTWSVLFVAGAEGTALRAFFYGAIAVFLFFTLGVATRVTSVLTWILVVSFQANIATRYDADYLLAILAFYMMIGYLLLGQWSGDLSVWQRLLGTRAGGWPGSLLQNIASSQKSPEQRGAEHPSYAANLAIRLLQVHFALIVVSSGLHKLQSGAWWSGTGFWYALHPPYTTTESQIRAVSQIRDGYLVALSLIQYAVIAWQLGFPLFAWRRGLMRVVLIGGAALCWLACWDLYQMPLFGPIYLIGCLSFLSHDEWLAVRNTGQRLFGRVGGKSSQKEAKIAT